MFINHNFLIGSGAPADSDDFVNPNWAPTLNLGHSESVFNATKGMKSMKRYKCSSKCYAQTTKSAAAGGLFQSGIQLGE